MLNHPHIRKPYTVVMGLGITGFACVRFLSQQSINVHVMDSRPQPPKLELLRTELPDVSYEVGRFNTDLLCHAKEIVISPGISLHEPALADALNKGVPVISEIELFLRYATAPVVAITGSNGKSTVTTLLGEMVQAAGLRVGVGGNLGTPALDLLSLQPDWFVLELSSFQLETTYSLNAHAATILNLSADHLDRYRSFADYCNAKQNIFRGQGVMVLNADDPQVMTMQHSERQILTFSGFSLQGDWHCVERDGQWLLARRCEHFTLPVLAASDMPNSSAIMRSNALAALALGETMNLPLAPMLDVLRHFKGLPHRCEWVAKVRGVDYFNDSKGTNVGATLAAVQGLERPQQLILIAGGDGKGADFSPLVDIAKQLRAVVLIGRDAPILATVFAPYTTVFHANDMENAVQTAHEQAQQGDAVLLSPACASLDMYANYQQRGEFFIAAVKELEG